MSAVLLPSSPTRLLRDAVSHFTPNWFSVSMGTGALALVLAAQPWGGAARLVLAAGLWRADAVVFGLCLALLLARLALSPAALGELLRHPQQSLFLGALPMGLVPLINGLVLFAGAPAYGLAEALWWLDAALSLAVAVGVPYWVFTRQAHSLEKLTAALLLPIVAPEVAASSAAVIAPHLAPAAAQRLVEAGYVLWGVSVPLAFSVLALVLLRLVLHKLPARELGVTSWLTLGPIGTGALGLVTLGEAGVTAFAGTPLAGAMATARDAGLLGALLLWGAGLWWLASALLFTAHYLRDGRLPFNLGWWGFTFPLGVYTLATLALARTTGSALLAGLGQGLALLLLALWLIVAGRTLAELARLARA